MDEGAGGNWGTWGGGAGQGLGGARQGVEEQGMFSPQSPSSLCLEFRAALSHRGLIMGLASSAFSFTLATT